MAAGYGVPAGGRIAVRRSRAAGLWLITDWPTALVGAATLIFAFVPFTLIAWHAARHHELFFGAGGFYPWDTAQYLSWVRDAHGGLSRTLLGVAGGRVFFSPMWSPSGWVQALTGLSDATIVGFWKFVGVLVLVIGMARVAARFIPVEQRARRGVALLLGVWGGITPPVLVALLPHYLESQPGRFSLNFTALLTTPVLSLWDWTPQAISIGLVCFAFCRIDRLLSDRASTRAWLTPAGLGLIACLLNPWQGETLLLGTLVAGAWHAWPAASMGDVRARADMMLRALPSGILVVVIATAAPLFYYLALGRWDPAWSVGQALERAQSTLPPLELLGYLVALVGLPAWLAWRGRLTAGLRVPAAWALGAAITLVFTPGNGRGLDGTTIPLVLLAVGTWPALQRGRLSLTRWSTYGLVLLTVTLTFSAVAVLPISQITGSSPTELLTQSDLAALQLAGRLARGAPVITDYRYGVWLEAVADAEAWDAHAFWTPDFSQRGTVADELLNGRLSEPAVSALLRTSRADVVVQPCGYPANIAATLSAAGLPHERSFGCVRVYSSYDAP